MSDRYAVAVDLGTTTIACALIDCADGRQLTTGRVPNPQAAFGRDIMTRLTLAQRSPATAARLSEAARRGVREAIAAACAECSLDHRLIGRGVLVANSAMHHLLLGLDITSLAAAPFAPVSCVSRAVSLPDLPPLDALPLIGGFVGSDAVAGTVASGIMAAGAGTALLIDVGTNSEIVLAHRGRLFACSVPAGPAFEGGDISQGMQAAAGAVSSVRAAGDRLLLEVIGDEPARGICGSGLVDAAATLLMTGAIDSSGRLTGTGPLAGRMLPDEQGRPMAIILADGLRLTQADIRALQLAKGAVRSGVEALLRVAGARPGDISVMLLAGEFGAHLAPGSAVAIGLVPPIAIERIRLAGNAALSGAALAVLSPDRRADAERVAASTAHVSLPDLPGYQNLFIDALDFPDRRRP